MDATLLSHLKPSKWYFRSFLCQKPIFTFEDTLCNHQNHTSLSKNTSQLLDYARLTQTHPPPPNSAWSEASISPAWQMLSQRIAMLHKRKILVQGIRLRHNDRHMIIGSSSCVASPMAALQCLARSDSCVMIFVGSNIINPSHTLPTGNGSCSKRSTWDILTQIAAVPWEPRGKKPGDKEARGMLQTRQASPNCFWSSWFHVTPPNQADRTEDGPTMTWNWWFC